MKTKSRLRHLSWFIASAIAVTMVIIGGILVWFPISQAGLRTERVSRFSFLGLAIHSCRESNPAFPVSGARDKTDGPKCSWRVLLLPFLEDMDLYKRYRFDEPWDGPHNRLLIKEMDPLYRSPASGKRGAGVTNYVAVVGLGTAWSADENTRRRASLHQPKVLLIEFLESDIKWSEPRDLTIEKAAQVIHGGTFYLGTDLHYHEVPADATPEEIRKLLTVDER